MGGGALGSNKTNGFTIIEVALVLAVAALIFLVVFLAVPALQRNQRDDARKRDVASVAEAVTKYVAAEKSAINNAWGTLPYTDGKPRLGSGDALEEYLDQLSSNIDYVVTVKNAYRVFPTTFLPEPVSSPLFVDDTRGSDGGYYPAVNKIIVYQAAKCDGNTGIQVANKLSRAVAVQIENGGNGKYYCQDAGS